MGFIMFVPHASVWLFVVAALLAGPHVISGTIRLLAAAALFGMGFIALLMWTYGGVPQ